MDHDTPETDLLDRAAGHMHAAAALAESLSSEDVFSDWHGLAGQVRLTAAGVSHTPTTPTDPPASVTGRLTSALAVLDGVDPLNGPPDLQLWVWHIRELRDLTAAMERP
jgi:hypothetical protein